VAKTVMYEEAVKVPLLLRVPWLEGCPGRIEAPVSQIDLVPTLLDLLGRLVPSRLQGRSWRPHLHDLETFPERDVVIEWNGADGTPIGNEPRDLPEYLDAITTYEEARRAAGAPIRTIVTPTGWKFNCSPIGEDELYNLREDPGERTNLIGEPAVRELVADLYKRLLDWQEETADDARPASDPGQK
jgi:arylsulfatase A-like enzyme